MKEGARDNEDGELEGKGSVSFFQLDFLSFSLSLSFGGSERKGGIWRG